MYTNSYDDLQYEIMHKFQVHKQVVVRIQRKVSNFMHLYQ